MAHMTVTKCHIARCPLSLCLTKIKALKYQGIPNIPLSNNTASCTNCVVTEIQKTHSKQLTCKN